MLVRSHGGDVPHALLVRVLRASGLAADAVGGIDRIDVELHATGRALSAKRSDRYASLVVGSQLATAVPGTLIDDMRKALDAARRQRRPACREETCGSRRQPAPVVVLLENPFVDPDRPKGDVPRSMACGTFQLASALRGHGVETRIVPGKLDRRQGFSDMGALGRAVHGGATMIGMTVLEACFEQEISLVRLLREMGGPLIVAGGPMATLTPLHVAAHMGPPVLVVRGGGEEALPSLARTLAGGFCGTAMETILGMDGVLYIGPSVAAAGHLNATNDPDPDSTPMDFSLLGPEHIGGGLSLETARGCTNPCLFCTTPGRHAHRGRSPDVVAGHLAAYSSRLRDLFGDDPPAPSRRVQICDDDFTCDHERAALVLRVMGRSGLALGAFQASVRDLVGGHGPDGTAIMRGDLLDSIRPSLFQDSASGRALASRPHGRLPARMSSFVHLGVESFCDADLRRLGKGYSAADACAVIDALDARGIVHDAYLILSGPGTTLDDLVTSLLEVARMKVEHPSTFFVRIPVVPFVVPTFASRAFRTWSRRIAIGAMAGSIETGRVLSIEGYPDLDYPLVARGLPADREVRDACESWETIIEADPLLVGPARNLEAFLRGRLESVQDAARASCIRRNVRRLSGARKLIVYRGLARARRNELPDRVSAAYWSAAESLGPAESVAREARNLMDVGDPRLVVIPTRDCSLRCAYCPMDKAPGMVMSPDVLDRAIELLMSSGSRDLILQFFGGEALLCRDLVLGGMERASEMAVAAGKNLGFILSTNGLSLDDELLARISRLPVKIEVSVDGTPDVHNRHRRPRDNGIDSYAMATRFAGDLVRSGIPHEAIMVVTPATVGRLAESFAHVASLGFERIQVNHALSVMWSREHKEAFARELVEIERRFFDGGPAASGIQWVDLGTFTRPMLLNGEITVDHDGTIYFGNGFLVRTATPRDFAAGHLDDLASMDTYLAGRPDNDYLVAHTYPPEVARNNMEVGRIYGSFIAHMRRRFPDELGTKKPTRRPGTGHPT